MALLHPESTLTWVKLHMCLHQSLKGFFNVAKRYCSVMDFDNYVIDIDLNVSTFLVCKHFVHQVLVYCSDIHESEWNLIITKVVAIGMNGHFIFIITFHLNLMITLVGIKDTLELKSFQGLKFLIYLRERVVILCADVV